MKIFSLLASSAIAALVAACVTGPNNGTAADGPVIGQVFSYGGYTDTPGELVTLQVLADPSFNPAAAASWVPFATTTTSTAGQTLNGHTDLYYPWAIDAAPVPSAAVAGRWPLGGVVRTRAVHGSGGILTTFDDPTYVDCLVDRYIAGDDWADLGVACAGVSNTKSGQTRLAGGNVGIASTALTPGDLPVAQKPDWLGRKGDVSPAETSAYYGTWGAPANLSAFLATFGFNGSEPTATYYNDGDLGLGREMHCKDFAIGPFGPVLLHGVACYVRNYSGIPGTAAFNVDPNSVLAQAVTHTGSFATVAMVYVLPNNQTFFAVYDAAGALSPVAQLDSTNAHHSVPNACLECHGISAYYDASPSGPTAHSVVDPTGSAPAARFLAFDPFSYRYSAAAGYGFGAQQESFRRLNALVMQTGPTAATADLITGMYAPTPVTSSGAVADDSYVPTGWAHADQSQDGKAMYNGVVKHGCRTCHASASYAPYDFLQLTDWTPLLSTIRRDVCARTSGAIRGHAMPQAERVSKNLWTSGARALIVSYTQPTVSAFPDPVAACDP